MSGSWPTPTGTIADSGSGCPFSAVPTAAARSEQVDGREKIWLYARQSIEQKSWGRQGLLPRSVRQGALPLKIFWSWQSDSPRKTNKEFIRDVLDSLCSELNQREGADPADRPDDESAD